MARLVEIGTELPRSLSLQPGDVLNVPASGGTVESGSDVVEAIGPLVPGVVALDGRVLSPETVPTNMLFRALRAGRARVGLTTGGGLMPAGKAVIEILVEPGSAGSNGRPA
jgi:hypothetical protein